MGRHAKPKLKKERKHRVVAPVAIMAIAAATTGGFSVLSGNTSPGFPGALPKETTGPMTRINLDSFVAGDHSNAAPVVTVSDSIPETYVVVEGDTLSGIAQKKFGNSDLWPALWWSNKTKVTDPDLLHAGEVLSLHVWKPDAWLAAYALRKADPAVVLTSDVHLTTTAPAPTESVVHSAASGSFEACVETAESGGDPTAINRSSGASGLFGFLLSTWDSVPASAGYPGGALTAPVAVQDEAFAELYARDGMSPWDADGCPQRFGE